MLSEIDSWGGTTNHLKVWLQYGCDAWRADTFGSLHQAIERATERVHGTLPVIETRLLSGLIVPCLLVAGCSRPDLMCALQQLLSALTCCNGHCVI
jgi:hypothetical protein